MTSSSDRGGPDAEAVATVTAPIDARALRDRLDAGRPLLVRGLVKHWPATQRWTPAFFKEQYRDSLTVVERWRNGHATTEPSDYLANRAYSREPLGQAVAEMERADKPPGSLYITYADLLAAAPELTDDIEPLHLEYGFGAACPAPVRRALSKRPGFWLGPAGTVTTLHFDRQENFSAQICGRKRWTLFSPADSAALYFPSPDMPIQLFSPVNLDAPDLARFPRFRDARPLVAEPGPGDVLYVPPGWWHHVKTLEMAITVNFWWWSLPSAWTALRLGYRQTGYSLAGLVHRRPGAITMPKD